MKLIDIEKTHLVCKEIVVLLAVLLISAGCSQQPSIDPLVIIEKDGGFEIAQGDAKVLFYQSQARSLNGKHTRSHYIHPLYGLDGEILTENFPSDHPHQRGIFWAWHQMLVGDKPVGDGWILEDFSYDVQDVKILKKDSLSSALKAEVLWKSPLWLDSDGRQKPFIKETTIIRVHNVKDDIRKIDFEISLMALEDEVYIGGSSNRTGYGGFSARIKMPDDLVFTGTKGNVEPQEHSVQAGPWVDFTAKFQTGEQLSGITILSHSSIPDYPNRWVLRRKESMQNARFPGQQTYKLPKNEPLVLRYRLIVHRGNLSIEAIDKLQDEYNKMSF